MRGRTLFITSLRVRSGTLACPPDHFSKHELFETDEETHLDAESGYVPQATLLPAVAQCQRCGAETMVKGKSHLRNCSRNESPGVP